MPDDDDIVCHWHGVGLIESDEGWSCPACPKPSTVERLRAENDDLTAQRDRLFTTPHQDPPEKNDIHG